MKPLTLSIAALALTSALGLAASDVQAQSHRKPAAAASGPMELPAASEEQLHAAQRAHMGTYQCEFGQSLSVQANERHPGYVDVKFQNQLMTMKPVLTSTGSLRLEDLRGERMLLQIANKSMLMDQRVGKRLVDGCVHAAQRISVRPAGLLD